MVEQHWARPDTPVGTGVLVLAGSSGRVDVVRADLLAAAGATALAIRWFGGEGQPDAPRLVPLETFTDALDLLSTECDRLAVLGLSYGAEAALLTAVRDPRVDAVVAVAPTDVAWEGQRLREQDPALSKWTWRDRPVPFVPLDPSWEPPTDPPAFAAYYLHSRAIAAPGVVDAATIPVERIAGEVVLVAGGDDQVWPSAAAARAIAARRATHGLPTTLVEDPDAGHPVALPGEEAPDPRRPYLVGGDEGSAERLGAAAWPAIRAALRLR